MILLVVYTVGPAIRTVFLFFKWIGKIKIANQEIPRLEPGAIVIANHPDLLDCMFEIFLVPAIFFPQIALHPLRLAPYFTPDRRNFTDKWWWAWLRPMAISVDRSKEHGGVREARKMLDTASEHKRVMMLLPEGGRTCTGKIFRWSRSKRKKIRDLKRSVGWLISRTQAPVLTMWLENGNPPDQPAKRLFSWPSFKRGPILVRLGKFMQFSREDDSVQITDKIANNLLELADQG